MNDIKKETTLREELIAISVNDDGFYLEFEEDRIIKFIEQKLSEAEKKGRIDENRWHQEKIKLLYELVPNLFDDDRVKFMREVFENRISELEKK